MRAVFLVFGVAALCAGACELEPPPKPKPPPPPVAQPVTAEQAPAAGSGSAVAAGSGSAAAPAAGSGSAAAAGSGSGAPAIEVSDDCVQAGVRVADQLIADASDAAQKTTLERDKTKIVRRTAEACTTQKWSADAIKCYVTAKSMAGLRKCEKKLPQQPQPPRPPPPKRNPKVPR